MSVGKRISEAREALGLSKTDLAKKMDVSYQTITEWETDQITPRPKRFPMLAKALKTTQQWLFLGTDYSSDDASSQEPDGFCLISLFETFSSSDSNYEEFVKAQIVNQISINTEWLKSKTSFTEPDNLSLITALDDSMSPTIDQGDILLIDEGVSEIGIDAIYVVAINEKLYIKRFQTQPDGTLIMKNDNKAYDPYLVKESDQLVVFGRVVLNWSTTKH